MTVHRGHSHVYFLSFLAQGRDRAGERIQIVDSGDSALSALLQTLVSYFSLASLLPPTPCCFQVSFLFLYLFTSLSSTWDP